MSPILIDQARKLCKDFGISHNSWEDDYKYFIPVNFNQDSHQHFCKIYNFGEKNCKVHPIRDTILKNSKLII